MLASARRLEQVDHGVQSLADEARLDVDDALAALAEHPTPRDG
jgi:hypothetical protein